MGFFSWRCAKSDKPLMAGPSVIGSPWEFASKAVVLFEDGSCIRGTYDGYGEVIGNGGHHTTELERGGEWRMVIEKYYNGEVFADFPKKNRNDPNQGFFYDDADLEREFSGDTP